MESFSHVEHTLKRLEHRLLELSAWKDQGNQVLTGGLFQALGAKKAGKIKVGDHWHSREFPVRLEFETSVPKSWAGKPVNVRFRVGGEGKLSVNGRLVGGLNPYHTEHRILEKAKSDEILRFEIEAVPKGLFGSPNLEPKLEEASLVLPDLELRGFVEDLSAAHDAAGHLLKNARGEIAVLICNAIETALLRLELLRSPSENYLARVVQDPRAANMLASIWDEWHFTAAPLELPAAVRGQFAARRKAFAAAINALKRRYPSEGQLFVTGHAHIDLAWLWTFEETHRKIRRTFGTMLSLMDRYPDFHFNQSSAQAYAFVEQDDPELFKRIQARVKEGRWDLVGGMWVEPDGNLLSGESWARQLLYGQRYFRAKFNQTVKVCWLPDTFGYSANLPQILRQGGIDWFFTTKLNWNETNPFPYDLYQWEGIDGSKVIAHSFFNPGQGYNGNIAALDLLGTWKNFKGKQHSETSLFSFGWGDGGGGPTEEMLERFERLKDFPGLPKLETGRVQELYQRFEKEVAAGTELPVWMGEQYLELHRGTYTTQAKTKWFHRRLEHTLVEAESACTLAWKLLGTLYPQDELYQAWTTLLRHQFHDVLPGSSVRAVYDAAHRDLESTLKTVENLRDQALKTLSNNVKLEGSNAAAKVVVWNLTLHQRALRLQMPRPTKGAFRLLTPDGIEVGYQELEDQIVVSDSSLTLPSMGYLTLAVVAGTPQKTKSALKASATTLENEHLSIKIASDGTLQSVFDKTTARETLAGRGNQIWAYTDIPREWDAWEIDAKYDQDGVELLATSKPKLEYRGLLEACILVERRFENAVIEQRYRLRAGSRRLDIETHIRWQGRRTLLRALFPLEIRSHEAWFETAFGAVARPTHRNTSWDSARFEVNAHRWADLSEAGYGVSLLNDGKYGHSIHKNLMGLTLLRSPVFPDPLAEEGEHHFTYSIYPHQGDWRGDTILEAQDLNAPLKACVVPSSKGKWAASQSFVQLNGHGLQLSSLKKAEDSNEIVLRVYEALGGRGSAKLETGLGIKKALNVNFLEEGTSKTKSNAAGFEFEYTPFSVSSLKLG
jgi:alpha-mannosidase